MSDVLQMSPIATKNHLPHPNIITMASQEDDSVVEDTINVSAIDPSLEATKFDDILSPFRATPDHLESLSPLPNPSQSSAAASPVNRRYSSVPTSRSRIQSRIRSQRTQVNNNVRRLLRKVKFSRAMTDQVMLWFNDCKNRGLFNSAKHRDYGVVWKEVIGRCKELWPRYNWSDKVIKTKYDTERRRFQLWKILVDEYSGVTLDPDTSLPLMSDATWEQFVRRHNTSSRSVIWLKITLLGNVEVYRSVFFRERASGYYIAEVDDINSTQLEASDLEDSGRDIPELLDSESDKDDNDIIAQSPTVQRLTSAQQQRQETDPDQTPLQESSSAVEIPIQQTARRRNVNNKERNSIVFASSLQTAASTIAALQLPGADDLATAVDDLQQRFIGKVTDEELLNCLEYLQENPMRAVIWNKLGDLIKHLYIDRWKGGQ